jgi:hypothetical protein
VGSENHAVFFHGISGTGCEMALIELSKESIETTTNGLTIIAEIMVGVGLIYIGYTIWKAIPQPELRGFGICAMIGGVSILLAIVVRYFNLVAVV